MSCKKFDTKEEEKIYLSELSTLIFMPSKQPRYCFFHVWFYISELPGNKLSNFLEQRINKFTKAREPNCGHITIRVLSSSEKSLDAKMGLRSK